jgi:hypothetical protein
MELNPLLGFRADQHYSKLHLLNVTSSITEDGLYGGWEMREIKDTLKILPIP